MKYKQISTDTWIDEYVGALPLAEKAVFIYLFTNDRVGMTGIYRLTDKYIMFMLGIDQSLLDHLKTKFENDRKYFFYKGWIYIVNNHKHVKFSTARNIIQAFQKEFNSIPTEIKEYFFTHKELKFSFPFEEQKISFHFSKNWEIEIETVMEMEMERRVGGRVGGTLEKYTNVINENMDFKEIDDGIRLMDQLKTKSLQN
jgi:hypothetical protein